MSDDQFFFQYSKTLREVGMKKLGVKKLSLDFVIKI